KTPTAEPGATARTSLGLAPPPLQHQIPAIDIQRRPRDVAGGFGGEEADEVGDFDGVSETADGEGLGDGLELLGGGVFARQLGVEEPGTDSVDGDAVGSQLFG